MSDSTAKCTIFIMMRVDTSMSTGDSAHSASGYAMLTGRFEWRRGLVVLVGIFVIFGAVSIVAGIRSLAGGL